MYNKIIVFDENQNEEVVPQINGLTITFNGSNNVVKVEKGSIFRSSRITLSNNCKVNIERTDSYGIRNLSAELSNYCTLKIGKNFRCVSLRISAQSEENLNVTVGDNCTFANNVLIRPTDGHAIYDINTKELLNKGEDIIIGNHVWSGLNSVFLKGAKVSDNSIVGANSVVNKKLDEENVVIAGSPAKIVKHGVNWTMENPGQYFGNHVGLKDFGDSVGFEKSGNPIISVIIPVYNTENYLKECLDSVVNQTLKDIEIICVNDGSTDDSLNILEEYQQKDDRIKIINQKNQGAGVARNQGLKVATGKYLSILDADDFFDSNMLELMYKQALETDADITICKVDGYDNDNGNFQEMSWALKERFLPGKDVFDYTDIRKHVFDFVVGWSWDKLFKSSFVFENNLQFQDLRSTNDMLFVFLALVKAKKITTLDKILAHHRINVTTSLSQTREKDPLCFYDAIKALKEELIQENLFNEVEQSFINWSLHFCFWHMNTNGRSEYIQSELKNRIFNELEFYKYPKSYFYDEKLYNRLMEISDASSDDLIFRKRKFDKILSFVYISKKEHLNPRNIYRILKAKGLIKALNLFDGRYYLTKYPYIRNSNIDPLDHYIYHGWKENRTPSKKFDGNYYLKRYPDVGESKVNPLVHYVLHGKDEGRSPHNQADYNTRFLETKKIEKHPSLEPSDKPRVSIIIPIFNVEIYLKECLDSVVNQTLQDIEIICVNDGSTDGSLSILEEYQRKDKRIKIISKPNSGYGHTVNLGLDAATGEYIGIVEPDDYVALDMYETLYVEAVKNDVDFIKADFNRFTGSGTNLKKTYQEVAREDGNYYRIINPQNELKVFKFVMNTWNGIYKRDFIEKNHIRHNETPGASFQDNGFWFQTSALATKVYFLKKPFYMNRRDNENSSVHNKAKVFAMPKEYEFIRNFLDNNAKLNENPKFKEELTHYYQLKRFHNYVFTLNRIGPEFHKTFLEKFHEDYVLAAKNNELDKKLFSDSEWDYLQLIIKDPSKIYELYYKYSDDGLIFRKRKFDKISSFAYISKKEHLNSRNIHRIYKARGLIKSLNLFDERYYLTRYPHVRFSNMDPLDHYVYHGWKENRTPSKEFDGNYYLKRYPDVKESKVNPLVHYVLHGKDEGRFPNQQAEINSPENKIKRLENNTKRLKNSLFELNNQVEILKNELNETGKNFQNELNNNKEQHTKEIENLNRNFKGSVNQQKREINNLSKEIKRYAREVNKYTRLFTIGHINKEKVACEIELFKGLGVTEEKRSPQIIVSLTSYPDRIYDIHYCLYSLLNQNFKPDKLILWLSKEEFPNLEEDLPSHVLNMKKHGLEINWSEKNFRSYDKLIHSLKEYPDDIIVTADDDVFYPKDWLKRLYENYDGKNVISHRAHLVSFESGSLKPYLQWERRIENGKITSLNFPTGAGGVLYPPNVFYKDVLKDELFLKLSPDADDIWFWGMVVLNNKKIKVLKNGYRNLTYVNPERELSLNDDGILFKENLHGRNDRQLSALIEHYPEIKNKLLEELEERSKLKEPSPSNE